MLVAISNDNVGGGAYDAPKRPPCLKGAVFLPILGKKTGGL